MSAKIENVRIGFQGSEFDVPMTATQRNAYEKMFKAAIAEAGDAAVQRKNGAALAIRQWAEANGHEGILGRRGRISREIVAAYEAAMKSAKKSAAKPATAKPASKPATDSAPTTAGELVNA